MSIDRFIANQCRLARVRLLGGLGASGVLWSVVAPTSVLAAVVDTAPANMARNFVSTDLELDHERISSRVIDIDGYGVDVDGKH